MPVCRHPAGHVCCSEPRLAASQAQGQPTQDTSLLQDPAGQADTAQVCLCHRVRVMLKDERYQHRNFFYYLHVFIYFNVSVVVNIVYIVILMVLCMIP